MNPKYYSNVPSGFFSGRLLVIAILVVLSSVSFMLGYFVGRSGTAVEEPVKTASLYQPPETGRPGDEGETGTEETSSKALQEVKEDEESSTVAGKKGDETTRELLRIQEEVKPSSATLPPVKSKKTASRHPEKKKVKNELATKKTSRYYTIQVGAFSRHSQARRLEQKLSKKGYHVEVVRSGGEKTIYRVRVGKYRDRKAAEVAAIRLTRTEGLKTFVIRQGS
jgi:cell division septation protein DedD